jgi:lipopolysaccharide biosynthesis regulator YciM
MKKPSRTAGQEKQNGGTINFNNIKKTDVPEDKAQQIISKALDSEKSEQRIEVEMKSVACKIPKDYLKAIKILAFEEEIKNVNEYVRELIEKDLKRRGVI